MVGAVLVREGRILAEAWHEEFGKAHAERALLERLEGLVDPGDVLYVNLEPCCHRGKTPPCTDIIIERGVKNVVYGMDDPNPMVAGLGLEQLRKAGVDVRGPLERARCEWLNTGFTSFIRKGRPWVTLKQAGTRDGRIATEDGSPLKITSQEQDRWAHRELRARHDAILVGVETIVRDDPQLTVRHGDTGFQPLRIVLDPHLRMPLTAKVISGDRARGTFVLCGPDHPLATLEELQRRGVRIAVIPIRGGLFAWEKLWNALTTPTGDFHGIATILVEGGRRTWHTFREARAVDMEVTLVGPGEGGHRENFAYRLCPRRYSLR
jgi:diaminohydroxyphosphoribosylaminopyrimidine deaminase/5-amino-6-(5-phosphoribosylamino)uracil reductase